MNGSDSGTVNASCAAEADAGEGETVCTLPPVTVTAEAAYFYDLNLVQVAGEVTLNGLLLPNVSSPPSGTRGWVVFKERTSGGTVSLPVGASGPGRFVGKLFAGVYDVDFKVSSLLPNFRLHAGTQTRLASGVVIRQSQTYAYDLKVARVTGEVTLRQAALPDVPNANQGTRGWMSFRDVTTGDAADFPLGATGAARYEGHVFAGAYDVVFVVNDLGTRYSTTAGAFARVASDVKIFQDGAYAYDARLVHVTGRITLNGEQLPNSTGTDRGWIVFSDVLSQSVARIPLASSGPGNFDGYVFEGTHRLDFNANDLGVEGRDVRGLSTRLAGCNAP